MADRATDGYGSVMNRDRDRHMSDSNARPEPHHSTSSRNHDPHSHHHHHHRSAEHDREAFLRLEQQVSYNYTCIQSHAESLSRFDQVLGQFQSDVQRMLDDFRSELKSRPGLPPTNGQTHGRYDDVDVLAGQITTINTKVNEVDNLKIELELIKRKVKRLEEEAAPQSLQIPRPNTASSHRDGIQPHSHSSHQPLPPIQTGVASPDRSRPAYHHSSHQEPPYRPEHRTSNDHYRQDERPSQAGVSNWRPVGGAPNGVRDESQATGWASVNVNGPKRPYDEHHREHSAPISPKRPKLAPLKPRNSLGDESHVPQHHRDNNHHRMHYDAPPAPQLLTTPASATPMQSAFRFITSTGSADSADHWRHDDGLAPNSARNRNRGRGKPRPMDGRGTPEWDGKPPDWNAPQQLSPNGYYTSAGRHPPREPAMHEYPLTPIASAVSPQDHSLVPGEPGLGKKTRTKPTRNSEGVLIRKDGRPDMRSVSSANNLRKVHAKKEAERADADSRTPMSTRSLAPASPLAQGSNSRSGSDDEEQRNSQDRVDEASRSATPSRPDSFKEKIQPLTSGDADVPRESGEAREARDEKWYKSEPLPVRASSGDAKTGEEASAEDADRRA